MNTRTDAQIKRMADDWRAALVEALDPATRAVVAWAALNCHELEREPAPSGSMTASQQILIALFRQLDGQQQRAVLEALALFRRNETAGRN